MNSHAILCYGLLFGIMAKQVMMVVPWGKFLQECRLKQ